MILNSSFSVSASDDWVKKHNSEVLEIVDAFKRDRPVRVPLFCNEWVGQHGFYAYETNLDYTKYYTDPDEMIRVQLEAARSRREMPVYDMELGVAPQKWNVSVDLWPVVAPGAFGCKLLYRSDEVIAHQGLGLSVEECINLEMPNPLKGGILGTVLEFYNHLKETYEDRLMFIGSPVGKIGTGIGVSGLFSLALDIRGAEIMADMYETPEFVHGFLEKLASWIDALETTWDNLAGLPVRPFTASDHGIDMLPVHLYEEFIVPVVKRHNRLRGTEFIKQFHHCGRGMHLFDTARKSFGVTGFVALTYPLLDIAKVRRDIGEEVWITAAIDNSIVQSGTEDEIWNTVKELMQSGAKGNGRLSLMIGDMLKGIPYKNMIALYEAVKEYGRY